MLLLCLATAYCYNGRCGVQTPPPPSLIVFLSFFVVKFRTTCAPVSFLFQFFGLGLNTMTFYSDVLSEFDTT